MVDMCKGACMRQCSGQCGEGCDNVMDLVVGTAAGGRPQSRGGGAIFFDRIDCVKGLHAPQSSCGLPGVQSEGAGQGWGVLGRRRRTEVEARELRIEKEWAEDRREVKEDEEGSKGSTKNSL